MIATTEKTEKKLLYVDEAEARSYQRVLRKGQKILKEIEGIYEDLSIGNLTRQRLEEIVNRDFTELEKDVWKVVNQDLSQFETRYVTEALKEEVRERVAEFKRQAGILVNKFNEARFVANRSYPLTVEKYSIRAGRVELPEDRMKKLIHDHCAVYVETPEQAEFYAMLLQAQQACSRCKDFINEHQIGTPLFFIQYQAPGFLVEEADGIRINAREMNF